jgi:hypothetical protein
MLGAGSRRFLDSGSGSDHGGYTAVALKKIMKMPHRFIGEELEVLFSPKISSLSPP